MGDADDTIAAIATASGRAGIGVVRVSGPRAGSIMRAIAGRTLPPRVASYTRFRDSAGAILDEGIALFYPAPNSYTGEDVVEFQGHGGPTVLQMVLQRCLDLGARAAEPGEFTRWAFLNDKLDLAQAEAVADLIDASTQQAARSAARSLTGEFSQRVAGLQNRLTELRALLEAGFDFPEEDIDGLARAEVESRLHGLADDLAQTLASARQGALLRDGMTVVLAGLPNVGKSSIINVLCHENVAIVTSIAGTTRDLIRRTIQLRGVPMHLIDTAGIRSPHDPIEEIGIARTWDAVEEADCILLLSDVTDSGSELGEDIVRQLAARTLIHVHNKCDLVSGPAKRCLVDGEEHVWVSAKTGAGFDLLEEAILQHAGAGDLSVGVFSARKRHVRALLCAADAVTAALSRLDQLELAAEELRVAQAALSELTGEVAADDLLGEIFSRFCIGK